MSEDNENEGRLSRWSRRKIAVAREQPTEGVDPPELEAQEAEREARLAANREAAEAVDLETLDAESDFSIFMKEGVPELLKKRAMAILWRSNPIFANVDGLVDYDDDFGSPDLIMKTFQSAYQAGRGYLDLFEEKAQTEQVAEAEGREPVEAETDEPAEDIAGSVDEEENFSAGNVITEEEPGGFDDEEDWEEEPAPKVSLRRRLELDVTG